MNILYPNEAFYASAVIPWEYQIYIFVGLSHLCVRVQTTVCQQDYKFSTKIKTWTFFRLLVGKLFDNCADTQNHNGPKSHFVYKNNVTMVQNDEVGGVDTPRVITYASWEELF